MTCQFKISLSLSVAIAAPVCRMNIVTHFSGRRISYHWKLNLNQTVSSVLVKSYRPYV